MIDTLLRHKERALAEIQARLPILFPVHPRMVKRVREFGLEGRLAAMPDLRVMEPLGYLEFLNLMANARLVLTDQGAEEPRSKGAEVSK